MLSIVIAAGAILSAVLITMLNAWMNTPNGFNESAFIQSGKVTGIVIWAPFVTTSTLAEVAHVLPTVLFAGVMLVGGYFAWRNIRSKDIEEKTMLTKGLKIAASLGIITIVLAVLSGINEITTLLQLQPLKYSAIELNPMPGTNLPEKLFGSLKNGKFYGGIADSSSAIIPCPDRNRNQNTSRAITVSIFELASALRAYNLRHNGHWRLCPRVFLFSLFYRLGSLEKKTARVQTLSLQLDSSRLLRSNNYGVRMGDR